MIITLDAGNTNVVTGIFIRGKSDPLYTFRLPSTTDWAEDDWYEKLEKLFRSNMLDPGSIEGGILCSVVPRITPKLHDALLRLSGKPVLLLDQSLDTGLEIVNYDRQSLGNDRVADAVAALRSFKPPITIFDLGTATTLSVLDRRGRFTGGMILPGVGISAEALSKKAAQLPEISLLPPKSLLGSDAAGCMQSGIIYGAASMIDGLADRVADMLGQEVSRVVTGGLGRLVYPYCRHRVYYDEHLLLKGLYYIYTEHNERKKVSRIS